MDYGLHGQDSISGRGRRFFSIPKCLDRLWGTLKLSNGYRSFSSEVRRPRREAYYSTPSSSEVKSYTSIPHTSS
jgi:hypothetical protein